MSPYALVNVLGGLGMLLFGLKTMSEALQVLANGGLRRLISAIDSGRIAGVSTGVRASMITQSSAVTTVMVVSFVNAGLMALPHAAAIILGANLGASLGGWVLALRLGGAALALFGLGVWLNLFANNERVKFSGELAMGVGLLFIGLALLEQGLAPLRGGAMGVAAGGLDARLALALAGGTATLLMRSTGAMVGVTMALGAVGAVDFSGAAALVIGANLGGALVTQLTVRAATADGRRAAAFHLLANVLAAAVLLAAFPAWVAALDAVVPGNPHVAETGTVARVMAAHIAAAHTTFNLLLVLLGMPLLGPLGAIAARLVGPGARERTGLAFLRPDIVESPALAIEQCRLEVLQMAAIAGEALQRTRQLYDDVTSPGTDIRAAILALEKRTDTTQHEITVFMSRVVAGVLTVAQSAESRGLLRVADEIESVADYCERLANYRRRLLRAHIVFGDDALRDLQSYLDRTIAFYEEIVDRARRNETGWRLAIVTKGHYLASEADGLREANLQRLTNQRIEPAAGIFFNDMLLAMRRIRNHALNMAEAWLGMK
jgi:phosphate:Na+ symporter